MDNMSKTALDKPTTLIGQLASRLNENNRKLIEVRDTLRNFVNRTSGESLESPPEAETAPVPSGVLADIDNGLTHQSKLLDDMNEVVSAVNKIA